MEVILKPQQLELFKKSGLEPQWITSKQPNRAALYLNSRDYANQDNPVDILASTASKPGDFPSVLAYGITRISVNSGAIFFNIPNINPRNNNVQFFSSVTGLVYGVTVPEGDYVTSTQIITALVAALNTVTGSSGLTFSFTTITGFPNKYNLNSAGGNYYFILTSNGVQNGFGLWNLPLSQVATNTKVVGDIEGYYTRYVDFCSSTLSKYAKIRTQSTSTVSNLILRVPFGSTTVFDGLLTQGGANIPDSQYYYNPGESITQIDIQLRDEFGQLLYVPNMTGNFDGFWWDLTLVIET